MQAILLPPCGLVMYHWRRRNCIAVSKWICWLALYCSTYNTATTGWLVEPLLAVASSFAMSIAWMMSVRNEKASIGTRAVSSN